MGDFDIQRGTTLVGAVREDATKAAREKAVDRGLNAIVDFVKQKYGERKVEIGTVFERYLENATLRYNQIRTLATGTAPRNIIGDDSLYVSIGLEYNGKEIDTNTVDSLLKISQNLLILGLGGVGKSMLTRYLFLDTAEYEGYVPVLIELRRIGVQSSGQISILDLIYACLQDFGAELPRDQFEYSLQLGKYLFLFDGFDEVKSSLAKETAEAIQKFSAKYPKNAFIVTSRPREETSPLETFTVMRSMPLSKEQAIDLAGRIWAEDEKTREFCQQLDKELYEKHESFAKNPLLLSMMFLTFMRNSSIPEHLSDFYSKAYDALYSAHDNHDKGSYRRDFECKTLDEKEFKRILAYFCFHTYFDETYEFSEEEILRYLQNSLTKLKFDDVQARNYLADLRNIVCMIVKDGETYRFSHRSFQTYFAAYYTSHWLMDDQQKKLFNQILSTRRVYWSKRDYYTLLMQIELDRFAENALESELRKLSESAKSSEYPDKFLLTSIFVGFEIDVPFREVEGAIDERISYEVSSRPGEYYRYNIIALFLDCCEYLYPDSDGTPCENYANNVHTIKSYMARILRKEARTIPRTIGRSMPVSEFTFDMIDSSDSLTDDERHDIYNALVQCWEGNGVYNKICNWLDTLDAKRASLDSPSFIDDL